MASLLNKTPKADSYKLFEDKITFEPYLDLIKDRKLRTVFAKLRLSDHHLMIEEGRRKRPRIPREERFCPFCKTEIENELHFLIRCQKFQDRQKILDYIGNTYPSFKDIVEDEQKFTFLMTQEHCSILYNLTKAIERWFEVREKSL